MFLHECWANVSISCLKLRKIDHKISWLCNVLLSTSSDLLVTWKCAKNPICQRLALWKILKFVTREPVEWQVDGVFTISPQNADNWNTSTRGSEQENWFISLIPQVSFYFSKGQGENLSHKSNNLSCTLKVTLKTMFKSEDM